MALRANCCGEACALAAASTGRVSSALGSAMKSAMAFSEGIEGCQSVSPVHRVEGQRSLREGRDPLQV